MPRISNVGGSSGGSSLTIGVDVQAWDEHLDQIAALSPTANNFIVGNGSEWALETASDARTSLGLVAGGAGDIWVEKAGDTMTGNLAFTNAAATIGWDTDHMSINAAAGAGVYLFEDAETGERPELRVYGFTDDSGATQNYLSFFVNTFNSGIIEGSVANVTFTKPVSISSASGLILGQFNGDSIPVVFGQGADASIYYDGTNLLIDTDDVGTGAAVFSRHVIINEAGADADTRIEGDTDINLLYIDAGNDRVGIGTSTPAALFDVDGTARMTTLNIGGTDVTATAAELNILDGATLTVTELNYVDGVTSAIQTQLDAKGDMNDLVDDTTPQLGGDLDLNEFDIELTPAPASDHTTSGVIAPMTAGASLAFPNVCYVGADGKMELADADAIATSSAVAICLETTAEDATGDFLFVGFIRDDTWAWTVGGLIYLSTTAGGITQTAPSATDDVIQVLGVATHADRIYFNPQLVQVEHV